MKARSRAVRVAAVATALAIVGVACGGDDDDDADGGATEETSGGETDETSGGGEDTEGTGGVTPVEEDRSLEGESVEILGAYSGEEDDRMRTTLEPLIEATGIDVTYVDSPAFDTEIVTRVEGGDLPDIAFFPQPGLLLDIAEETGAVPVGEYLDLAALEASLIPGFLDATTTADGDVMAFPVRMAVKSALWYPVPEFEDAGYALPTSDVDIAALEDEIIAAGETPWCLSMESGGGTGWVATDWLEEYMLRLHGPEVYDQWVSHEIPFNDPLVKEAAEKFEALWNKPDNVVGGSQGILSLGFGDSPDDLFTDPPGCWMHRQGNFITGFFPEDVQADLDSQIGVTYFPPVEGGYDGSPVLAGGDLALLLNDTPAARKVMEFLATDTYGESWAQEGGWLSPHKGFDPENYPTQVEKDLAAIGANATVLRFDASDLMPGVVGTGSFWTEMVNWIGGQSSLDEALDNIEASWPS